jgi:hypothetical protein
VDQGKDCASAGSLSAAITPDYITVNEASSPDGNLGLLSVNETSTTPITSLAIHVNSTGTDLLDPAVTKNLRHERVAIRDRVHGHHPHHHRAAPARGLRRHR